MENSTREIQLKLLELMKIFHKVCERNKITYYMLGGTMLGAVRHKGFIPWDDDMDVGLPRQEYEKLLSLPQSEWPNNIYIKTPYNSTDLIFPYSKLMDINTTIVEDRLNGIVEGVYIDIFPLDGAGNSTIAARIKFYFSYWKQGLLYNNQDYGMKKTILRRTVQKYAKKQDIKKLYRDVEKWMKRSDFYRSSIVGNFSGSWRLKEFMKKEYMGSPVLYRFENTDLYGPENADKYLTSLYGEYMRLPPIDERKSHHRFIYINLKQPFFNYKCNKSILEVDE